MDVERELVDDVLAQEGGGQVGAAEREVATGLRLRSVICSGTTSRRMVVFQSARSRVRENTIWGMSRQLRANWTIGAGPPPLSGPEATK